MNDSITFGVELNTSNLITHEVTVVCETVKHVFRATCMKDDDDDSTGFWEVIDGDKTYDNYIEIDEDDTITICINSECSFANVEDLEEDGLNVKIIGTSFDDEPVRIIAKCILGEEGTMDNLVHVTSDYDDEDYDVEDDDYEYEEDTDDDFEFRENPCRFLDIDFGNFKEYCSALENRGFQLVEYNDKKTVATFTGWYLNRKCEVEVSSFGYKNLVRWVFVRFAPTKSGRKIAKLYRDIVNHFSEVYGEPSNSEDDPADFDTDELIDAVNSSNFSFKTEFDFFNRSYQLINDIEISLLATIDDNFDDAAQVEINYSVYEKYYDVNLDSGDENIVDDGTIKFAKEHPYLNYFCLVGVLTNQELFDKTHDAISNIINFFEDNCFAEDFTDLIGQVLPQDDDEFTFEQYMKMILMGDVFSCVAGIGGEIDMKTPHCVIVPMLSMKLFYNIDLENGMQIAGIDNEMFESLQNLANSAMESRNSFNNYETFLISDIFSYYDKKKQVEYIDLMIRLCKCLIAYENPHSNQASSFIKHLYQIQKINKGILAEN